MDGRSHVHPTGVSTRAVAIRGHAPGPALAVAEGRAIRELLGFIFDPRIGVGLESPAPGDLFVHVVDRCWFGYLGAQS